MIIKRIAHPFFGVVVNKLYGGERRDSLYRFKICISYDRFLGHKPISTIFDSKAIWLRPEYIKPVRDTQLKGFYERQ